MQKIIGKYYAEYDHETRLWSILRRELGKPQTSHYWGTIEPIRYPVLVKIWFPRWVSSALLNRGLRL